MADPVISKAGGQIAGAGPAAGAETAAKAKQGPSNFDRVQKSVAAAREAGPTALPPMVEHVTPTERRALAGEVRRKQDAQPDAGVRGVFGSDLQQAGAQLGELRRRVDSVPKTGAAGAIELRLNQIEGQYQNAAAALERLGNLSDPRSLLQMQIQMYAMTQNLEVVSKAVEQLNSGVKTIMQTQV